MEHSELIEILDAADMVLVGMGEDFEGKEALEQNEDYLKVCGEIADAGMEWIMPYVNRYFSEKNEKLQMALLALKKLLDKRNYFVVSVCMNGMAAETGILPERMTEPCGSYTKLQCASGCEGSILPVETMFLKEIEKCIRGEKEWRMLETPVCEQCQSPMVFNSLYAEHYAEEGYKAGWERYTKWLQGTLGKKLCVLELGAGLMFAGILRFRFEKIVALNQKAGIVRIHRSLYQMPNEISGRGKSISQNAVDFMAETAKL